MAVPIGDRRLRPRATERRSRSEQQQQVIVRLLVAKYPLGNREQSRQFDERRNPLAIAKRRLEHLLSSRAEPQGAQASDIGHPQQAGLFNADQIAL
jgi:hypothetical protein